MHQELSLFEKWNVIFCYKFIEIVKIYSQRDLLGISLLLTMITYSLFVILLNFVSIRSEIIRLDGDLTEGDECLINDSVYGYCEVVVPFQVSKCGTYFKDVMSKKEKVFLCGFKGRASVICCPETVIKETPNVPVRYEKPKVKLDYRSCVDNYIDLREEVDYSSWQSVHVETYESDFPGIVRIFIAKILNEI